MKVRWFRFSGAMYVEIEDKTLLIGVREMDPHPYPSAHHKRLHATSVVVTLMPITPDDHFKIHGRVYLGINDFRHMNYGWRRTVLYLSNNPGLIFDPLWNREVPLI